jgi:hypothetical protein
VEESNESPVRRRLVGQFEEWPGPAIFFIDPHGIFHEKFFEGQSPGIICSVPPSNSTLW